MKIGCFVLFLALAAVIPVAAQPDNQPNFVNLVLNSPTLVIAFPDQHISSSERRIWRQYGNDIRMSFNPNSKVKPASELTDEDLSGNSVFFLGNPVTNGRIIEFMKDLPEGAVKEDKLSFGGREFTGKNIFLLVGGPSSRCDKKYFLFGLSFGTSPQISGECLREALKYDFLIGDQYGVISSGIFAIHGDKLNLRIRWT